MPTETPEETPKRNKAYYQARCELLEEEVDRLKEALRFQPQTTTEDIFDTVVEGAEKILAEAKKYRPVVEGWLRKLTTKE